MWVKIDDGCATHPKILTAGIIALGIQIRAICYASQNQTDGVLTLACIPLLLTGLAHISIETGGNTLVGWGVDAEEVDWASHMVEHGLWDQHEQGYIIHDFLEWNVSKSERDTWRNKLSRSGKKGMRARWNKGKVIITKVITKDITNPVTSTSTSTSSLSSLKSSLSSPDSEEGKESEKGEFETFWNHYPKKVGKKAAQKAFQNAQDRPRIDDLLASLSRQVGSPQWCKDGGQYIPHPATWLNRGQWADVATQIVERNDPNGFLAGMQAFLERGNDDEA